jgi:hypothetical protein
VTDELPSDDARAAASSTYPADTALAEILHDLEDRGFGSQFDVDEETGSCRCAACGETSGAHDVTALEARRIEGASDPGEMSNVLGLACPRCGTRGTVVCRYGPEASAGEAALLRAVRGTTTRSEPGAGPT